MELVEVFAGFAAALRLNNDIAAKAGTNAIFNALVNCQICNFFYLLIRYSFVKIYRIEIHNSLRLAKIPCQ